MAKALKYAAIGLGVAALAVVTGGAAVGLGVSLGTTLIGTSISASALLAGSALASTAASLLTKSPKVPTAQTDRLSASIDPRAFRKTVLGQTAFPVDVRYEEWSGNDQEYCDWVVALASHAIDGIEEIWLNTEMAWSQTTGVTAKYRGYFSIPNLVLEGSPANAFSFASGRWNGSARLTGCAYARLRFKVTGNSKKAESPFASGIPSRITIIGRGAKLYDPRRDSTVPGGSGPMRAGDQSTWRYTADDGAVIGENLPLHILRVVLGWRIRNPSTGEMKLATGSGVPARRLNLGSWITAANLADEQVNRSAGGTEPRYHGAGVISEGDEPKTSLDAMCAACCARFRDTSGKLSIAISYNDLANAATDDGLGNDDVVGGFTWDPDPSLAATPNVIRGRYVDASTNSLYQLIDYPEVRLASPDGQDRILPLDLGVVESASHAQRVAKQVLQRRQYQREFTAPFDIRAWKYTVGDVVPFTFAPLSFTRTLFRVKEQELGQGGTCNMTLTIEHPQIYAFDRDDAAPVLAAEPIVYDASRNPLILAIADAGNTATWDGVTGTAKPADNATNSADPNSPFGPGGTVGDVQRAIDAAKARQDTLENVTIPAVDKAVKDAGDRITAARQDAAKAVADANVRIDGAVRDFAAEVDRAQGADEALTRRIDAIVAEGGYDDTDVRALISSEATVRADDDRALGRRVDTVSASVKSGDDAVRADVKVTTDALARADAAFAEQARVIEASLGTVDSRIAAKAQEVTTAYADADRALGRRIDSIVAEGGYDDRDVRAEISRVDQAAVSRDNAVVQRVDNVITDYQGRDSATNTRITQQVTALSDADRALGTRSMALEAAASFASSSAVRNDNFNFWPDSQPNPASWATWVAQGNYRVERLSPGRAGGQYCVRTLNDVANVDSGFYQTIYTAGPGKWVVEVTVDSASNGLSGAGVSLHGIWNLDFCGDPDTSGRVGDSSNGEVRSWSKMFDLNAQDVINVHAMHGWSGFGRTIVPKYMTWHCLRLRPATDGEIKAGKADAALNNPGGVLARISSNEAVLADLPNRYASAQRTDNIEVSLNNARGRLATVETATTDGRFVAVQRVNDIEASLNDSRATVSQQAGAIVGLNGKTAAYVRVIADAGNGRAALSLWSDQFGGAWSLTGDGLIDGNLTINGTLKAKAFDRSSMSRYASSVWTGALTPSAGSRVMVPWSLGLSTIAPVGRFIYEFVAVVSSNDGQRQTSTRNGKPYYIDYVPAGGGLEVICLDPQGNGYRPRANGSDPVLATADFAPLFQASIGNSNYDTGIIDDGDYYMRQIAATYTVTRIELRLTWVAV